jgi:hypothetical protein
LSNLNDRNNFDKNKKSNLQTEESNINPNVNRVIGESVFDFEGELQKLNVKSIFKN